MGKKKKQPSRDKAFHIRKGDTVVVLSGDAKGKPGKPCSAGPRRDEEWTSSSRR